MNIITSRLKFSICLVLLMTIKSIGADASTITVKDVEGNLELNNTIIVTVDGLTSYIENSEKDPNKFILYLNWRPIKGLYPSYIPESGGQGKLRFDVDHTTDSENEWKALLGRPISKGWSYEVNVSIGYENEKPIPSDKLLPLVIIRKS